MCASLDQQCRTSSLLYALGKRVMSAQAKGLDALNLSHWVLFDIRADTATEDFQRVLLEKGVRSKPLTEKLITAIIHS